MIAHVVFGLLAVFLGYVVYIETTRPRPSKTRGPVPDARPVTSPRVKLSDGRHLAYKEKGVPREHAKYKIIVSHGFNDDKHFHLPISDELINNLGIYILSFDRAGYGESDPHPTRSVKSSAFDIQELADNLQLGPTFYLIGISVGSYPVYSCLKYIPHRISGVALVVPTVNFWWTCFPAKLSRQGFRTLPFLYQWRFLVAHYAPLVYNWWITTRKWVPSHGNADVFSGTDPEILEKTRKQGVWESLLRDLMVSFGEWGFEPTDISDPFPNNERGSVHMWQGCKDKVVPLVLNRYLSEKLPWIKYHEVPEAGHLLIYNSTYCEDIFKSLLSS